MRTFFIMLLLLILLALVGVSSAAIVKPELGERGMQILIERFDRPRDPKASPSLFSVATGDTSGKIGEDLEKKGVIANSTFFKLLVGYYGLDKSLKAGDYEVSSAMTMSEIISKLNQGLVKTTWLTIPEGLRLEEIANSLDQKGIFRKDDFLAALKGNYEYPFLRSRPPAASLDGYLFPDTYEIRTKSSAADFVVQMLSDFQVKFTPALMDSAAKKGLMVHQVLTLASIVEREAVTPAERPVIASVFLNRLDQKMPLYADPTVQYALGSDPASAARWGYWKAPLSQADLQINSPYNTYRNQGLPPGPIANPGLASIKAVLEPANTGYLYFVAKGDGSHAFAATIEEHNRNVGKYQGGP